MHADYRQRRPAGHARAARRLDGARGQVPAVAAAQRRRTCGSSTSRRPRACCDFAPTQTATWFDYNGDGWLDLFVGNESTLSTIGTRASCFATTVTAPSPTSRRESGVDAARLREGRRSAATTTTTDGPTCTCRLRKRATSCSTTTARRPDGTWRFSNVSATRRRRGADQELSDDVLRLRQRRLARHLRRRRFNRAPRTSPPTTSGSRRPPTATRLYRNQRNGTFADVTKAAGLCRVTPSHGAQLRRSRQRRLARPLRRHRQPGLRHARAEPDVPQRRRQAASRT